MRYLSPKYKYSQLSYDVFKTPNESMVYEYNELISAADKAYSKNEDMIYIITREYNNGDPIFSQSAIPLKGGDKRLTIGKPNGNMPRIFINVEDDVLDTLVRIVKNIIFL